MELQHELLGFLSTDAHPPLPSGFSGKRETWTVTKAQSFKENLSSFVVSSKVMHLLQYLQFFLEKDISMWEQSRNQSSTCSQKVVSDSRFCFFNSPTSLPSWKEIHEQSLKFNLSIIFISSNVAHLLLSFLEKNLNVVRTVTKSQFHLLPNSQLSFKVLFLQMLILSSLVAFLEKDRHEQFLKSKPHLFPKSKLSLDPPLGALQLSPAVSLPLLAKLPPRVNSFLEEKQQAAANKVEEERGKQKDTK